MSKWRDKIKQIESELRGLLPIAADNQKKLDKKFRLEFNYNSNHIEGNTLTYGETELLLIFDQTTGDHSFREFEEMKAHDAAIKLVEELASDLQRPLTESFIRNLNKTILVKPFWKKSETPDGQDSMKLIKVGEYKELPNFVRLKNGEIFEYASVSDTPILMGELIDWYRKEEEKSELHPIELAAILHHKFVHIHPFDDGNGRISRLLVNYVLLKHELPPIVIKSADKKNYLSALNKADVGDLSAFVEYIAQQAIWSLELSIKAAKGESIEERDDLDKEIEVWKKGVMNSSNSPISYNDSIGLKLFNDSLKNLLDQFENKAKKFDDLFESKESTISVNGRAVNSINDIPAGIKICIDQKKHMESDKASDNNFDHTSIIKKIEYQLLLIDYKFNGSHSFSLDVNVVIRFDPFEYIIREGIYGGPLLIKKSYNDVLREDEIAMIFDKLIKILFREIQSNIKK
jgi:Fic family protein